jgi:hypothetical protein
MGACGVENVGGRESSEERAAAFDADVDAELAGDGLEGRFGEREPLGRVWLDAGRACSEEVAHDVERESAVRVAERAALLGCEVEPHHAAGQDGGEHGCDVRPFRCRG